MQEDDDDQRGLVAWIIGLGVLTAIGTALALALATAMGGFGSGGAASGANPAASGATAASGAASASGTGAGVATAGAGAAAVALPLLAKLYFATDVATLNDEAQAAVRQALDAAKAHPAARIAISGFHDKTGDADRNAQLAKERAQAVRDALTAAGIDAARIELRKPELTEGGADDREARRVEVRIE